MSTRAQRTFGWVGMLLSLSILCSACSGADADPCEVLTAQDVAAVLRVNGLVATESPLRGAGRICTYGVRGPSSSAPQTASTPLINLSISNIAALARYDRDADLLPGHRELRLAGVDRATISTVDGGSGGASLVRGDRTAALHLYDAGLSVQEQQRTLEELASRIVEHWSNMDD